MRVSGETEPIAISDGGYGQPIQGPRIEDHSMSEQRQLQNQVRAYRIGRKWSQEELAVRAGISRAGVSAIEMGRLVPSATAVLALAAALECRVEDLFSLVAEGQSSGQWAWEPAGEPCRYWHASVAGRKLLYPIEPTCMPLAHEGIFHEGRFEDRSQVPASDILVVASCDPALGLLANEYHRLSGFHILALQRPSREALSLLARGLVHVAGVHLERRGQHGGNAAAAREILGDAFCLLRTAFWQEGLAVASSRRVRSVQRAVDGRLRWVGREPGSAAGELQQELLCGRVPKHVARGHRNLAEAVRAGWADVGVCVRLASEEAGLDFLTVREEACDLCFPAEGSGDPRVQALVETVQSPAYRLVIRDLPGYDVSQTGELERVDCK
jgi:molybdate-binding protein/DNA-binding XRE family transcriptional regulator